VGGNFDGGFLQKLLALDGPIDQILQVVIDILEDDVLYKFALLVLGVEEVLRGLAGTSMWTTFSQSLIMKRISYYLLSWFPTFSMRFNATRFCVLRSSA
jgi:hypothetical protein